MVSRGKEGTSGETFTFIIFNNSGFRQLIWFLCKLQMSIESFKYQAFL